MSHRILTPLALCCLLAVCSPVVRSQQKSVSNEAQLADERLREKAFALLESLAGQLGSLQSTENRARIGSNLVDSLWSHDERRARALLAEVENDVRNGLRVSTDNARDQRTLQVFLKLRVDTVERVAKHDPELALSFLKRTKVISDRRLPFDSERDAALELRLAKQIVAENPDIALRIGRESLERDFAAELIPLLLRLQPKHGDQASVLYREIVAKLRQTNLRENWGAAYFARNLAKSFTPTSADESTFRDLVGLLITSSTESGCSDKYPKNQRLCSLLGSLLPQIEKVDPGRAAQLKRWASEGNYWDYGPMYAELNETAANSSISNLLDLAKKYPLLRRDIYQRAVSKALSTGDIENARRIAGTYDGDLEGQASLLIQIDDHQKWMTLNEETLAEVQKRLNTMATAEERLSLLASLADRIGPTNSKTAVMLLDQANGIVDTVSPGLKQTQMQVVVAILYCLFKNDRGFTLIESLIPRLNELIAAAAKLDGFDTNYLREGEWNMSADGNLGQILTALSQNAGAFAWCDFDRAVTLTGQFERPEIRLMAQLKLAQGILTGPKKTIVREH